MSSSSESFTTPDWVHRAIFYQIFPDRFASSTQIPKPGNLETWESEPTSAGFKGGDLLGAAEHLDYLDDLGINAIYLNPVFQSASNHRYHTHDYFQVDPLLGGNQAFRTFLDLAHKKDIRVILDGVFNHASRGFFPFNHILETGSKSPYLDWFTVYDYPLNAYEGRPNYKCWWNLPALPSFNTSNPQVRHFIFDVANYWIEQGIDGWRLDVPFEIKDPAFWQEFRHIVKTSNPEAYLTGEIPWNAAEWLQGDQFDGVMNYLLTYAIWGFFAGENIVDNLVGHWREHAPEYFSSKAEDFARNVSALLGKYPRPAVLAQLNLLDSHDTARLLSICGGRKDLFKLATLFQMTYPGAPSIYYGDEIGLEGGKDPGCRRSFPWNKSVWDGDLRNFVQDCIRIRKSFPALQSGHWEPLYASEGVIVSLSSTLKQQVITIINRSSHPFDTAAIQVENKLPEEKSFTNKLGPGGVSVQQHYLTGLIVAPYSGAVLA